MALTLTYVVGKCFFQIGAILIGLYDLQLIAPGYGTKAYPAGRWRKLQFCRR